MTRKPVEERALKEFLLAELIKLLSLQILLIKADFFFSRYSHFFHPIKFGKSILPTRVIL